MNSGVTHGCWGELLSRDGQGGLRNILLKDTVIGKIKYLITRYRSSQKRISDHTILDTLEKGIYDNVSRH